MNGLCRQQFGQFSIFLLELIQPLLLFKRLTEQCFSGFESEFVGSEFILFFFQGIRDAVYDLVTELQDRDALENNAILIQPVCCLPLKGDRVILGSKERRYGVLSDCHDLHSIVLPQYISLL